MCHSCRCADIEIIIACIGSRQGTRSAIRKGDVARSSSRGSHAGILTIRNRNIPGWGVGRIAKCTGDGVGYRNRLPQRRRIGGMGSDYGGGVGLVNGEA